MKLMVQSASGAYQSDVASPGLNRRESPKRARAGYTVIFG